MAAIEPLWLEREADAGRHVVTERHRAEQRLAGSALAHGHGERRRHHGAAGMAEASGMGVVGFIGVGGDAARERRIGCGGPHIAAGDERLARTAFGPHVIDGEAARLQPRARQHGGQGVEDMMPDLFRHLRH